MASSHTLVGHFREPLQQDITQLIDHSAGILRVLDKTKNAKPSVSPDPYIEALAAELSIPIENAARILQALENLQRITQETGSADKTFSLISSRLDSGPRRKWSDASVTVRKLLEIIVDNHPAVISQKAIRLSYSHDSLLIDAEILTDARPIYTMNGDRVLEMVVSHSLVITRHGSDHRNQDFYFALDASDIIKLKNACERAILKGNVLKEALSVGQWTTGILQDNEA